MTGLLLCFVAAAWGAPAAVPLANGGDLFINSCRPVGETLVCAPWRITIFPGARPRMRTTKLPEVTQPITHERVPPGLFAFPGLMGSTVDIEHRRIYWHADCNAGYHVTDIDSGVTTSFALDLYALGIDDQGQGLCLGEWVYDARRQVAVALAGRQVRDGGEDTNEKSRVEYALAIDAQGGVRILHDLRGKLDPAFQFVHPFQTIASLDPDHDEVIAQLFLPPAAQDQMVLNLDTGNVTLVGPGDGRQHRFFDLSTRAHTAFDCFIPGFTNSLAGHDGFYRITIDAMELAAQGISDICIGGFVGGAYDPIGRKEFLLLRTQAITAAGVFLLGVADMATDRWLGFIDTDASYGALGMAEVGDARLFLSTEFVPARGRRQRPHRGDE